MVKRLLLFSVLLSIVMCAPLACSTAGTTDPCVSTLAATEVTATHATLNGVLEDLGASSGVQVWFEVKDASGAFSGDTPKQPLGAPGAFYYVLTNLDPGTDYTFTACAEAASPDISEVARGATQPFTTPGTTTVTTGDATDLTPSSPTSVTLHGEVVSMGSASNLLLKFELGTTTGVYTDTYLIWNPSTSPEAFSYPVYTLTPDTTYYYRAVGEDSMHGLSGYGQEKTFKTYKGKQLTIDTCQLVFEGSTVKAIGTATNTGDIPLTQAQIGVYFKDASGGGLDAVVVNTGGLSIGEVWNWEATYSGGNVSSVDHCEAVLGSLWI